MQNLEFRSFRDYIVNSVAAKQQRWWQWKNGKVNWENWWQQITLWCFCTQEKNCAKKCHGKLLLDQKQQRDNSHIGLIGSNPIFLGLESDICHGLFRENSVLHLLFLLFAQCWLLFFKKNSLWKYPGLIFLNLSTT